MMKRTICSIMEMLIETKYRFVSCIFIITLVFVQEVDVKAKLMSVQENSPYHFGRPDFPYKSPEAAGFQKYGDWKISEYTGNANITVPLYTLQDKDFTIPLILNYDASGIKVAQEASWVGLGWNLMIGGCINFVPSGQVDRYNRLGNWADYNTAYDVKNTYMKSSNFKTYNDSDFFDFENGYIPKTNGYYTSVIPDLCQGLGERDFYTVNVMGKSFKFFFNPYTCKLEVIGNINEKFQVKAIAGDGTSITDPRHEVNLYHYTLGFVVTDSEGNEYRFGNVEFANDSRSTYPTAWNLTSIRTSRGTDIVFEYSKKYSYSINQILSEQYDFISSSGIDTNIKYIGYGNETLNAGYKRAIGWVVIEKSYLRAIKTPSQRITFDLDSNRLDLAGARLSAIKVESILSGRVLKNIKFNYGYFEACSRGGDYSQGMKENLSSVGEKQRKRLKLISVEDMTNGNLLKTSFEYNDTPLPFKTSYATDFWGYYNGQENINPERRMPTYRTSIPKAYTVTDFSNSTVTNFGGAIRFADKKYIEAATLVKIVYPTKGWSEFEYEPNTFSCNNWFFPEQNKYQAAISRSYIKSCTVDGKFHFGSAQVDDSNVHNQYMPQYSMKLIDVGASGKYKLHIAFRGDTRHSMADFQYDKARVVLLSHQDGHTYNYDVNKLIENDGTPIDRKYEASKDFVLNLDSGRYTFYAYLPDKYGENSKCIVSASITNVEVSVLGLRTGKDPSTGGGIRIKEIRNYTYGSGEMVNRTCYKYGKGKLLIPESYGKFWLKFTYKEPGSTPQKEDLLRNDHAFAGFTLSNFSLNFANSFVSSIAAGLVGYSDVTIEIFDGKEVLQKSVEKTFVNETANNLLRNFYQFDKFDNGELLSRKVRGKDGLLSSIRYIYTHKKEPITCNIRFEDRALVDHCYLQHCHPAGASGFCVNQRFYSVVYSYYKIFNQLKKTITTTYTKNGHVVSIHEYEYNDKNYLVNSDKFWMTDTLKPKQPISETRYKYPCDYNTGIYSMMVSDNVISPIIEQTFYYDGKISKSNHNNYSYRDFRLYRLYYPFQKSFTIGSTTPKYRMLYMYDSYLNLQSVAKDYVERITYLWSYNSTYPIAEIKGAQYGEIKSWLTENYIKSIADKLTITEKDLLDLKSRLSGKSVLVTLYLYEPGVGIKEVIQPNGNKMYYSYDAFNRLSSIKDLNGNTISNFNYNYKK